MSSPGSRYSTLALGSLALSLLIIGLLSGTVLRHVVQIVPALAALVLLWVDSPLGPWAARPIFLIWLAIMMMIWLTLTGIANLAPGTYTAGEIALTLVIGAACILGLASSARSRSIGLRRELGVTALSLAFQLFALWISFGEAFAYD